MFPEAKILENFSRGKHLNGRYAAASCTFGFGAGSHFFTGSFPALKRATSASRPVGPEVLHGKFADVDETSVITRAGEAEKSDH